MLRELTIDEFAKFVNESPLATHYQTLNYALLMGENGYDYDLIGFFNEYGQLKAASLILIKTIKFHTKYGYAPKGFIMDFFNQDLLKEFVLALKLYYKKKHVAFIKINPEIAISEIDTTNGVKTYNWNYDIKDILEDVGFYKLKDNLYFESLLPRFSAVVSLKNYSIHSVNKNCRNKIRRAEEKGLQFEKSEKSGIDILQHFISKKRNIGDFYYKDYYNVFSRNDMIDLFLVSIQANEFLVQARKHYEEELDRNNSFMKELERSHSQKAVNQKMDSDRKLLFYKADMELATEMNKQKDKLYIAGALVIHFQNRIQILISGFDQKYKSFDANYFLHHKILEYYKEHYDYAELNGITGDFSKNNPYYGLNQFKLGFNPRIYEYIGEYDLPIEHAKYQKLRSSGELAKIFNKTDIKIISQKEKKND